MWQHKQRQREEIMATHNQRRIDRDKQYETVANPSGSTPEFTSNLTTNTTNNQSIITDQDMAKTLKEQKEILQDLVLRDINIEYTYNSNDNKYKNRLIQEQIDKNQLMTLIDYNYKYKTKPKYIETITPEYTYTFDYAYEALNKIPEFDLTIEQEKAELYQSDKDNIIITKDEYDKLQDKKDYISI